MDNEWRGDVGRDNTISYWRNEAYVGGCII